MTASLPTLEELELVRDFVLLPMMIETVQNNSEKVRYSSLTMREFYLRADQKLIDTMNADLREVKKRLAIAKIKVEPLDSDQSALHYNLNCRGYRETFSMMKMLAKSEISTRLGKYVAGMFNK